MFASWGKLVYRLRYTVIGVMVVGLLGLAAYGLDVNDHLSQSGFDDPGSESVQASELADSTFGRDSTADVIVMYNAPPGETVDDPTFSAKVSDSLNSLVAQHPDQIAKINASYFKVTGVASAAALATADKQHAISSIAIAGNDDTTLANNFRLVKNDFGIDGISTEVSGLQPIAGALNDTLASDVHRMEILAIPAVAVLLFFIFGGVVAASLPLIVGGLTVIAANGIVKIFTNFTAVNSFVSPVVSLVGLGLAIDYGLFIVSRYREELGDGYEPHDAVRRSVMTAGRTVIFSATMIIASLGGLLLFPQGFLKSVAYGAIATVFLAAMCSITILPAMLSVLGRRVDALGLKSMRKTRSSAEIESGFWGRLTRWVMRNPLKVVVPIVLGLVLLTLPVGNIKFGGINETYLPPDNVTRVAQNHFDELFPGQRTEPIKLEIRGAQGASLNQITTQANKAPGLIEKFSVVGASKDGVIQFKAGLVDRNVSKPAINYIRSIALPAGASMLVGGTPTIEQDSIAALVNHLPLMALLVVLVVTVLMFLTFGSLVLPIKAVLMTTLGLGATMGILTWIFIEGHGAGLLDFSPGPIMAPVLVLIIAIIFGLSTDYEVFLLSRMVEARQAGASTSEAVRIGTSHTGRIISAAALILIVVTGAFAFSDLVMMKYIAYGMIAALIIDATLIRMFLVPATMKMLGDDCWWAPAWMKRIQRKIGLGEAALPDERMPMDVPELVGVGRGPMPAVKRDEPLTEPIPVVAQFNGGPTRASQEAQEDVRRTATGRPAVAPHDVDADTPVLTGSAATDESESDVPPASDASDTSTTAPSATEPRAVRPTPMLGRNRGARGVPKRETPDPRSIESWLADLRVPSPENSSAPDEGTPAPPEAPTPPVSAPRDYISEARVKLNEAVAKETPAQETSAPFRPTPAPNGSNGGHVNGVSGTNGSNGVNGSNGTNGSSATNGGSHSGSHNGDADHNDSGRHRGNSGANRIVSVSELLARENRE